MFRKLSAFAWEQKNALSTGAWSRATQAFCRFSTPTSVEFESSVSSKKVRAEVAIKFSNFGQNFPTAAKLSNFSETFQLQNKLSYFARFFPTSIGSFQFRLALSNFSKTFQLQTFQLKTFQLPVLSNCPFQLHVARKYPTFIRLRILLFAISVILTGFQRPQVPENW